MTHAGSYTTHSHLRSPGGPAHEWPNRSESRTVRGEEKASGRRADGGQLANGSRLSSHPCGYSSHSSGISPSHSGISNENEMT